MKKLIVAAIAALSVSGMSAQTAENNPPTTTNKTADAPKETKTVTFTIPDWLPQINGTICTNYSFDTDNNASHLCVKNARLSFSGSVVPEFEYKAEIDLCDEGKIKMLDAYLRYSPKRLPIMATMGQMRVPFTIDAHRAPHQQYFANKSFIAKFGGNIRDVGLAGQFNFKGVVPLTLQAGVFNGSGIANQKNYWTKTFNYSFKASAIISSKWTLVASCQKSCPEDVENMMWNGGISYDDGLWHIETEYLRKIYLNNTFEDMNIVNSFVSRKFPLKGALTSISALGRYDYMGDHSDGIKDEEGLLAVTQPERHRMTLGTTLTLGTERWVELRLNYEKYFYHEEDVIPESEADKLVLEVMCRF